MAEVKRRSTVRANDRWVTSVCGVCYNHCGIRVRVTDGVVRKIEGNPESPFGGGRLCAKGVGAIPMLYDPHRVNFPMKRTNPAKGLGVDPGWVRTTWDEALDLITEKLRKVRQDDPRKLMNCVGVSVGGGGGPGLALGLVWAPAFGTSNSISSNGHHCGSAEHRLVQYIHGTETASIDLDYCRYLLVFGCGIGGHAYYAYTTMAQRMADARARGMKLVVVDPVLSGVAEKADEWVPIRPGTDGALAMAMLHVLLNELQMYDAAYLRKHTNAPYLIGPDGRYVRDPETGKPLVWNTKEGQPRPYDDPPAEHCALDGSYQVHGVDARPALELLRERAASFPPERVQEITTVPAATIRRIAREFGEEARIGSTIVIQGKELPYRPAATIFFKGAHGHNHAWLSSFAMKSLNEVVGASDVPGGSLGSNARSDGFPATGLPRWAPREGPDGLLSMEYFQGLTEPGIRGRAGYPLEEPQYPTRVSLEDLFVTGHGGIHALLVTQDPARYGLPYTPEVLINWGANLVMSAGNPRVTEEALKRLFVISVNLWLDETTDLADVVLPDASFLERLDPTPNWWILHGPVGLGEWAHQLRQPAVPPLHERRPFREVLLELAERLDMVPEHNAVLNVFYGLRGQYALQPDRSYTLEEIADRAYKNLFGEEHGLAYFKEHGVITWPKRMEEVYWREASSIRSPVYMEFILPAAERIRAILGNLGIEGIDTEDYDPLPGWRPCAAREARTEEYDLRAVYYRVPWHQFSMTYQNPWLDEISQTEPYSYFACINTATALKKGLRDGDRVWIHSAEAGRVLARVRLVEGIHPEVVGIANNGGHWARQMPVALGKGVFFEALLAHDWKHTDVVANAIDCDAAVKLYRAGEDEACAMGWS